MLPNKMPQLSLVAQYDDLCRHTKVLTEGCEKEFKLYVESQKRLLRKRREAEAELESLRKTVANFEFERQKYETQIKHMRNLVMSENEKRKKLELEKASMENIIYLIKDVLVSNGSAIDQETKKKFEDFSNNYKHQTISPSRLTTIEESVGSLLSPSEGEESEEEVKIAVTQRKRRSKGKKSGEYSQKRRKSEERGDPISLEDGFNIDDYFETKKSTVKFCSNSELTSDSSETPISRPIIRSESAHATERTYATRRSSAFQYNDSTPAGRYSIGGKANKPHHFASKTVIKPEKCYPCGKPIKFARKVLKCERCRVACHPECKELCPEFCIPANFTPTKGVMETISSYAPSTPPMIPPLIIHCVGKIESCGLSEPGLYRVSGSEREVKDLKAKFLNGKSIPSLSGIDIHAVCGTIKDFLRSLKDTLIPEAAWQTFVDAGNHNDASRSLNMLFKAVCNLPQPNKDTLAFLILHWQKVANSKDCRMDVVNLAKVLAPTVIGYSDAVEPINTFNKIGLICTVMERLLKIPEDSWKNLLNRESDSPFTPHTPMKTPECTPAPVASRLGPFQTSGQKIKSTPIARTPLKPRTARTGSRVGKSNYFSSPLLQ